MTRIDHTNSGMVAASCPARATSKMVVMKLMATKTTTRRKMQRQHAKSTAGPGRPEVERRIDGPAGADAG